MKLTLNPRTYILHEGGGGGMACSPSPVVPASCWGVCFPHLHNCKISMVLPLVSPPSRSSPAEVLLFYHPKLVTPKSVTFLLFQLKINLQNCVHYKKIDNGKDKYAQKTKLLS